MSTVILQIKKQDILNSDYIDSKECALTKAYKRAGLNWLDCGLDIRENTTFDYFKPDNYEELVNKILNMYTITSTTKDFEFTLIY